MDSLGEDADSLAESQLPPAPDGGLHAWLKVLGGFLIYINIWGFTLSFGAFQAYYRSNLLSTQSASSISWIGTIQAWLLIVVGVLSGPLFDRGFLRSMLCAGNFLVVCGIMMLSLSTEYWQILLSQGICMGLGAGLLYIPSLALVGIWFDKKRAVAMGIVMSGIAVGGVIYILMLNRLIPRVGFPWAIRCMGFIALGTALLSFPALLSGSKLLTRPRKARKLFDKTALKDPLMLLFTASSFFNFIGYNIPYFYIPTFARETLGTSQSLALYTQVMAVGASFFGRLASGFVAHHIGSLVAWCLCAAVSGILVFSWMSITTIETFIAFSVLWGFLSASLVTLPASCFATICPDLSRLGTRMGMSWSVSSVASLIGPPIAGQLLRTKDDGRVDFRGLQIWSGCFLLLGSCTLAVLWYVSVKKLGKGWRI
ncbi:MFS monocarboxylate transporter-like protein [Periconia macrospinosa]|uniref:MFS monocarboxylate transporter-like protein n=1 Tax=Periconia macrospinosa TaxID=97972 RepID=A0A2V1DIB4_9PLEO|nr:MFS monocarboxylate transporter-like protein [Periconia macrospinosa]